MKTMKPTDENFWRVVVSEKPTTPSSKLWVVGYLDHQLWFTKHAQDACSQSCYRPNSGAFKARIGDGLIDTKAVNVRLISNKDIA